jgi:hypothetical protein
VRSYFQSILLLGFFLFILGNCAQNKYEILEKGNEAHYSAQEQWAFLLNNAQDFRKIYSLIHGQNTESIPQVDFKSNIVLAIFEAPHEPAVDLSVSESSHQKSGELSLMVNLKVNGQGGVNSPYVLVQINRKKYQSVTLIDDKEKLISSHSISPF